jgi:alkylation response protein AidB-like acyl-CoA dehydrogenase
LPDCVLAFYDRLHAVEPDQLAPVAKPAVPPSATTAGLRSNFTKGSYEEAVRRALRYIRAGDIYQVTLSQRFQAPCAGDPVDLALVFATLDPAERHVGLCAFLVPTDSERLKREPMPGVELGHRAADHARLVFNQCQVGPESLLGEPGEGFKVAMSALDHGRLGVAAGALGVAHACLEASVEFARSRRQFGKRIGDFEMIQASIAEMAADVDAARMLVYRAAWLKDQGQAATRETSIAKYFATEAAVRAADQAVLIHGARGYSNEYPVERYYRDIKGLQIYEGTSHIQRIVIARDIIGREERQE